MRESRSVLERLAVATAARAVDASSRGRVLYGALPTSTLTHASLHDVVGSLGRTRTATWSVETRTASARAHAPIGELMRQLPGVIRSRVGWTGGHTSDPTEANPGDHADAVEITFDPARTSYRVVLELFFQIHDPTTTNRQMEDVGTEYRSVIFYTDPSQRRTAEATIAGGPVLPAEAPGRRGVPLPPSGLETPAAGLRPLTDRCGALVRATARVTARRRTVVVVRRARAAYRLRHRSHNSAAKAGVLEGATTMEPAFRVYGGFDSAGLRVVGELDLGARGRLRSLLGELTARDVERVWLDLEGVSFIDCGCTREIENARRTVISAGHQFDLTAASPMFVRVAELASYAELASLGRAVVHQPWPSDEERQRTDDEFREVIAQVADLERLLERPD
jgi:anti-anti-sigma factor